MKKASIIGHFGEKSGQLSGQIVKTKIVTEALKNKFGAENITIFDTHGGIKTLFKSVSMVNKAFCDTKNVIIFPAQNALRVFASLVALKKRKYTSVKIHYVVIGGWLPVFIEKHKYLKKFLKDFDGIYVETFTMKSALDKMGFENVFVVPNCKELTVLKEEEMVFGKEESLRLCTFSRVMKEKGIEDAVRAVKKVNETLGRTVYALDIYGKVESGQEDWFSGLRASSPSFVKYKGEVPYGESVAVVKNYFALLFPTRFYTEGIPGTIIDAYAAGVPVICSKWESFTDLVLENKTGLGYEFGNIDMLISILKKAANNPEMILSLKKNCAEKARLYLPSEALKPLIERLN